MKVAAGSHVLKVKYSETRIYVVPGKSLRLSLHKGSFLKIQEKEIEKLQKPVEKVAEKKKPDDPTEEKTETKPKYNPFYWPLKHTSPIQ